MSKNVSKNEYLVAKIGVDTAENEPKKKSVFWPTLRFQAKQFRMFFGEKERQCLIEILRSEIGAKVCIV